MLFTDGLYEVEGDNQELYSQELLVAGVQQRAQLPAPQLFDELLTEVRRFSTDKKFADDVCLVGMEYAGAAARYERRMKTSATNSKRKTLLRASLE